MLLFNKLSISTMTNFKNAGLHITPDGYFHSTWDTNQQLFIAEQLSLEQIETHLNSVIYLDDNIRLHHIFTPILASKVFSIVFQQDFWTPFVEEIRTTPWKDYPSDVLPSEKIDGDDVQYLEVYDYWEYVEHRDGKKEIYNLPSRFSFHGIGYPFVDKELAEKNHVPIGYQMPYSLSTSPLTDYMNTPIRIGKFGMMCDIYAEEIHETVFEDVIIPISLNMLIHSILWDMSFYGVGKSREDFSSNLKESIAELEKNQNN